MQLLLLMWTMRHIVWKWSSNTDRFSQTIDIPQLGVIVERDNLFPSRRHVALCSTESDEASFVPDSQIVPRGSSQVQVVGEWRPHACVSEVCEPIMEGLKLGLSSLWLIDIQLVFRIWARRGNVVHVRQWHRIRDEMCFKLAVMILKKIWNVDFVIQANKIFCRKCGTLLNA